MARPTKFNPDEIRAKYEQVSSLYSNLTKWQVIYKTADMLGCTPQTVYNAIKNK